MAKTSLLRRWEGSFPPRYPLSGPWIFLIGRSSVALPPLLLLIGLVQLAYCDLVRRLLPKTMVHALTVVVFVGGVVVAAAGHEWQRLTVATVSAVAFFALLFVVNLLNPHWLAFGDVRLSFVVGFGLAWVSPVAAPRGVSRGQHGGGRRRRQPHRGSSCWAALGGALRSLPRGGHRVRPPDLELGPDERRARRNHRPGHGLLGHQSQVEQQLLAMVPGHTWRPTGSPSTSPAGMLTAGLPLRFDGAVSAAELKMARASPTSATRSCPGTVIGGGPSAAKATSGLVEQKTKSACSKSPAMASFSRRR